MKWNIEWSEYFFDQRIGYCENLFTLFQKNEFVILRSMQRINSWIVCFSLKKKRKKSYQLKNVLIKRKKINNSLKCQKFLYFFQKSFCQKNFQKKKLKKKEFLANSSRKKKVKNDTDIVEKKEEKHSV